MSWGANTSSMKVNTSIISEFYASYETSACVFFDFKMKNTDTSAVISYDPFDLRTLAKKSNSSSSNSDGGENSNNSGPSLESTGEERYIAVLKNTEMSSSNISMLNGVVDQDVPNRDKFTLVKDGNTILYHQFLITQQNIGSNNHKFYVAQVLQSAGEEYYFWTRWGRIGQMDSQSNLQGNLSKTEAIAALNEKFKAKTGNAWDLCAKDPTKFSFQQGKYSMVPLNDPVLETPKFFIETGGGVRRDAQNLTKRLLTEKNVNFFASDGNNNEITFYSLYDKLDFDLFSVPSSLNRLECYLNNHVSLPFDKVERVFSVMPKKRDQRTQPTQHIEQVAVVSNNNNVPHHCMQHPHFIQRILQYTRMTDFAVPVKLAHVSKSWDETMWEFQTVHILWKKILHAPKEVVALDTLRSIKLKMNQKFFDRRGTFCFENDASLLLHQSSYDSPEKQIVEKHNNDEDNDDENNNSSSFGQSSSSPFDEIRDDSEFAFLRQSHDELSSPNFGNKDISSEGLPNIISRLRINFSHKGFSTQYQTAISSWCPPFRLVRRKEIAATILEKMVALPNGYGERILLEGFFDPVFPDIPSMSLEMKDDSSGAAQPQTFSGDSIFATFIGGPNEGGYQSRRNFFQQTARRESFMSALIVRLLFSCLKVPTSGKNHRLLVQAIYEKILALGKDPKYEVSRAFSTKDSEGTPSELWLCNVNVGSEYAASHHGVSIFVAVENNCSIDLFKYLAETGAKQQYSRKSLSASSSSSLNDLVVQYIQNERELQKGQKRSLLYTAATHVNLEVYNYIRFECKILPEIFHGVPLTSSLTIHTQTTTTEVFSSKKNLLTVLFFNLLQEEDTAVVDDNNISPRQNIFDDVFDLMLMEDMRISKSIVDSIHRHHRTSPSSSEIDIGEYWIRVRNMYWKEFVAALIMNLSKYSLTTSSDRQLRILSRIPTQALLSCVFDFIGSLTYLTKASSSSEADKVKTLFGNVPRLLSDRLSKLSTAEEKRFELFGKGSVQENPLWYLMRFISSLVNPVTLELLQIFLNHGGDLIFHRGTLVRISIFGVADDWFTNDDGAISTIDFTEGKRFAEEEGACTILHTLVVWSGMAEHCRKISSTTTTTTTTKQTSRKSNVINFLSTLLHQIKTNFGDQKLREFVNARTEFGQNTALHLAAMFGQKDIIDEICDHFGANRKLKNKRDETVDDCWGTRIPVEKK